MESSCRKMVCKAPGFVRPSDGKRTGHEKGDGEDEDKSKRKWSGLHLGQ